MKKIHTNKGNVVVGILILGLIAWGAISLFSSNSDNDSTDSYKSTPAYNSYYSNNEDDGYAWAEDNDISSFDECQDRFGTSYKEDECNRYVKENYSGYDTFNGYGCTEDCSGHEAGYEWAEENDIDDEYDCDGNSDSFNEGCTAYVEENY